MSSLTDLYKINKQELKKRIRHGNVSYRQYEIFLNSLSQHEQDYFSNLFLTDTDIFDFENFVDSLLSKKEQEKLRNCLSQKGVENIDLHVWYGTNGKTALSMLVSKTFPVSYYHDGEFLKLKPNARFMFLNDVDTFVLNFIVENPQITYILITNELNFQNKFPLIKSLNCQLHEFDYNFSEMPRRCIDLYKMRTSFRKWLE